MLFMRFIWGIFLFAVTFLPASAVPVYPKPIALLLKSGFSSIRSFPAKSNLTGYILKHNGQYLIVYVTPDQQSLLTGELIDANGNDLNISYAKQYLPNSSLNQQFLHLKQTKTINEGDNIHPKKTLFVFFDPNCVFCHLLWKALQPYE
ncbi:MAG: hypothetical protein KGL58_08885, partial [Pseudomonadota bacterium]|nr:hypothetical protein [Pseudomonadota bacterium]